MSKNQIPLLCRLVIINKVDYYNSQFLVLVFNSISILIRLIIIVAANRENGNGI